MIEKRLTSKTMLSALKAAFEDGSSPDLVLGHGIRGLMGFLGLGENLGEPGVIGQRWSDRIDARVSLSVRKTLDSQLPGRPKSYKVTISDKSYGDDNTFLFTERADGSLRMASASLSYYGQRKSFSPVPSSIRIQAMDMMAMAADCCRTSPGADAPGEAAWFRKNINNLPLKAVQGIRPH